MTTNHLVDAKGLRCPMPVIQLQKTTRQSESGDQISIEYTDENAEKDIRSWCKINGHILLDKEPQLISETYDNQKVMVLLIQVK